MGGNIIIGRGVEISSQRIHLTLLKTVNLIQLALAHKWFPFSVYLI